MQNASSIPADAYVMIIGAMKAGTSSLFDLLAQHPALCAARAKEPEFFSAHQAHRVAAERYESLFDFDPAHHTVCLEASTGYTKFPEEAGVPQRMKAYGVEPRFIYIVRDPVDRFASQLNYAHLNNYAWGDANLFGLLAASVSMYHRQLSEFLAVYPDRDRYFVADFDDLKADPEALCRSVTDWLGLPAARFDDAGPRNATPARSEAELRLTRSGLHRFRHLLPESLRAHIKAALRARGTPAKRDLTEAEVGQLRAWLASDMQRFKETFGFPVERWGFDV
ncbi:MAG: sulfotransferase [Bacteroidota bacterium]